MEDVRQRLGGMGLSGVPSGVTMEQLSEMEWKLGEIKVSSSLIRQRGAVFGKWFLTELRPSREIKVDVVLATIGYTRYTKGAVETRPCPPAIVRTLLSLSQSSLVLPSHVLLHHTLAHLGSAGVSLRFKSDAK